MPGNTLTEENDNSLLSSQWLGKKDQHGKTHLFKYSNSPDGRSLVLVTTDLQSIYFHSPAAEEIPAVPWEVDHPFLLTTQDLIREQFSDEPMEQVEGLVERVRAMMEERWDEVQLLIELEDEVKVAYIRMDDFAWRFTLNELPSAQSVTFLTRHLLHPLTVLIATDRSIPLPPSSLIPAECSSRLISDPEIMRAIRRATSKPKPKSQSHAHSSSQQIPSSSSGIEGSPTPRKPPPKRVKEATPTPQSSSSMPPSSPPKLPSSSVQPESPPPLPPTSSSSHHLKSRITDQSSSPSAGSAMDFKPPTQRTKREREQEEEEMFEKRKKDLQKKMDKGGVGKLGKRRLAR